MPERSSPGERLAEPRAEIVGREQSGEIAISSGSLAVDAMSALRATTARIIPSRQGRIAARTQTAASAPMKA